MLTGDGLLVRLVPSGSTVALDAFTGLCTAARQHGNGIIEITSRGSIQFRGLSAASAPAFAAAVACLDIEVSDGIAVLSSPLSGLDADETLDAGGLAQALRAGLAPFATRLAPKISVVVDGGGTLHLDDVVADIRLRAIVAHGRLCIHIGLGGNAATAVSFGAVSPATAVESVCRLLAFLAAAGPQLRMRYAIAAEGAASFKSAVAGLASDAPLPAIRAAAEPIGIHQLRSGAVAVGIGLPFGHAPAGDL